MASNVNVTYEEMRTASNKLNAGKDDILGKLSELKNMINTLVNEGYVTDKSSKKFDENYTEFNDGATKMAEGLEGLASYLEAAADAFEQADTDLASAINK
ncbi:WXG100 family type VII secretion target [Kineosporia babensis]|uniref:ESAT-6-like protein n=1 Tax=Kineosporia babensis TaxID=499548 RepID=A0A9X1SWU2_9ACTN|nr:WXG100 family type VII secretion target [Kineosporia babensis]MCD5314395.1 WXG100 family type VII secretion target [Kineosporia babensis]